MATAMPTVNQAASTLFDKAICMNVRFGRLGVRRRVSASLVEVDADKSLIAVSKRILDADEIKAVQSHDSETRRWLYSRCLPTPFRGGTYMVPLGLIEEVEAYMRDRAIERRALIQDVLRVYDSLIAKMEPQLRTLWLEREYPSLESVEAAYYLEWNYVELGTPGKLRELSSALFKSEQKKAASLWADAVNDARQVLRAGLAEMVEHCVDKLTGTDQKGAPKKFKPSMVTKLNDFLTTFDLRNITDDVALRAQVEKARKIFNGVDYESLRDDSGTRRAVRSGFETIKTALSGMMIDKSGRKITFDED